MGEVEARQPAPPLLEATATGRRGTAAHCGRCHSEQGFLAWLPQLQKATRVDHQTRWVAGGRAFLLAWA